MFVSFQPSIWRSLLAIAFFSLLISHSAVAQSSVEAEPFDSVSGFNCESQRSNLDYFLAEISKIKNDRGLIRIYGTTAAPVMPYLQKMTIINHLKFRNFDLNRIIFEQGESSDGFRTDLLIVSGAYEPQNAINSWNFELDDVRNPILVHSEAFEDQMGCGLYQFDLDFYSKFLLVNKELKGRILILSPTFSQYKRKKAKIADNLLNKLKIPRSQIEFGFVESEKENVEYWFVPQLSA